MCIDLMILDFFWFYAFKFDNSGQLKEFNQKNLFLFGNLKDLLSPNNQINTNALCDPSKVLFGFYVSSK